MTNAQRVLLNTVAQYSRTIINILLSLYSTRLILSALGQSDYGIYALVAGVVSMLSFVTNALVVTTQRYLSFYHGRNDTEMVKTVFGSSLALHIILGVLLMSVLLCIEPLLFDGFLNIDKSRVEAAAFVYRFVSLMLVMTFCTAPFRAALVARENIVYISIVDVLDGLLKVAVALSISSYSNDRLELYAVLMTGISLFNLLAFGGYTSTQYSECSFRYIVRINSSYLKELGAFASWTIYSTGCILARTQGLAVLLNRFFGTVVNASYGIAMQVSGSVNFLANSITSALNPQIVKAEGAGDRSRMLYLSTEASKFAFLLLSMVSVPVIFEMPTLLGLWLVSVPDNAVMFCRMVMIASMCDQLTIGLGSANQAIGKIRNYSLAINTVKVFTLPAAWICLHVGFQSTSVMYCFVIFELLCALLRLPFLKVTAGLKVTVYLEKVFVKVIPPVILSVIVCCLCIRFVDIPYRFLLTGSVSMMFFSIVVLTYSVSIQERNIILNVIKKILGN